MSSNLWFDPSGNLSVAANANVTSNITGLSAVTSATSYQYHGLDVTGTINASGDVVIDGVSLKQTLQAINDRLNILVVDPDKLEKYAALKEAYDNYKLLEALCHEEKKD